MSKNETTKNEVKNETKFKKFLKRKNIEISVQRYLIDALGLMAQGLFASLLIGTIMKTIGVKLHIPFLNETIWPIAQQMTGAAIGVSVAYGLKSPALVLFASAITGTAGNALGGPAGAFIAAILGAEFGKIVSKETKIDIIITPAVTIIVGVLVGTAVGPAIGAFMTATGNLIMYATTLQPFIMGVLVSVIVGITLTLPISSAALCMMLGLTGIAGGAATAGCCAQMVGFAVMSYKENGWGGIASQGLGTSMLQVPNIVRNPKIWIPPMLVGAITGPMATMIFQMENSPIGSGMGTSGLVGIIETIPAMEAAGKGGGMMWIGILLLYIVIPVVLTPIIANFMRKKGWIKENDLKLNLE
ncbi:putative membrane protein [Sedimentibacter acidaminivorans]|uniref:Membrane protein n=1 Tax=Sedimentibacter acidaminivorans TaxID=913099 RepID=A0ABS4GEF6_9FIRM|nr:PTS sugar transporter subunit IIC [Sedimentibacter acidaminivorans]MBP1925887.1 putative membrane protein [Sedimentibacter acidaminivorans]